MKRKPKDMASLVKTHGNSNSTEFTKSLASTSVGLPLASTCTVLKVVSTRYVSVPHRKFLHDIPNTYMARLTNRQWRLVISVLSEANSVECDRLADDLIRFVLPPDFNNARHTTNDRDTD